MSKKVLISIMLVATFASEALFANSVFVRSGAWLLNYGQQSRRAVESVRLFSGFQGKEISREFVKLGQTAKLLGKKRKVNLLARSTQDGNVQDIDIVMTVQVGAKHRKGLVSQGLAKANSRADKYPLYEELKTVEKQIFDLISRNNLAEVVDQGVLSTRQLQYQTWSTSTTLFPKHGVAIERLGASSGRFGDSVTLANLGNGGKTAFYKLEMKLLVHRNHITPEKLDDILYAIEEAIAVGL